MSVPIFELGIPPEPPASDCEDHTRGSAAALLERLGRHYTGRRPGPTEPAGGVFLTEVGLNNGGRQRRVDAIHIGFTASSGHLLRGHEVKVSPADWLQELDQPGKADTWASQCHEWWLVTPHPSIVNAGELPAGWGHMVPDPRSKNRFKILVPADRKPTDFSPSWLIVRSLFARIDTIHRATLAAQLNDARIEARAAVETDMATLQDQAAKSWADQADAGRGRDLVTQLGGEEQIRTITPQEIRSALLALPGLRTINPGGLSRVPAIAAELHSLADHLTALQQAIGERTGTPR